MDFPPTVVRSRSTAALIEDCAATLRDASLAHQRVAEALGEAVEQLALLRHYARLLREQAWGDSHAARDFDSPARPPLAESCQAAATRSVTRQRSAMDGAVDTVILLLEPSMEMLAREHPGVHYPFEVSRIGDGTMTAEVSEQLHVQIPLGRSGEALHPRP
jgi:hypothetical protein